MCETSILIYPDAIIEAACEREMSQDKIYING